MTNKDTLNALQERLIGRLADYMKISHTAAESTFRDTDTARTLANSTANLRFQTEDYIFECLKEELANDDAIDDGFERPEEAPEGQFVRSH